MKLLSHIQPAKFLGIQHSQLITCGIPGRTAQLITCGIRGRTAHRKCSLCSESFTSQKELNDHVAAVHNYKFYVVIESVVMLLGVWNP